MILQAVFQYFANRLPMCYFTEGNIGKISSVLSTDMVFIEENCMMVLADMMNYLFSQAIMIVFMFVFDWRLGTGQQHLLLKNIKKRRWRTFWGQG